MLALHDISIAIKNDLLLKGSLKAYAGQLTLIWGPVGAGKTTLLNRLYHHSIPSWINGKKITNDSEWFLQTAYVHQDVHQYDEMTCEELKDCFCFDDTITFADVGLFYDAQKKIKNFSEGEKQRLNILVALWKNPYLLLLDEPTSFLDTETAQVILNLISEYTRSHQCMTLMTSHHEMDKTYADQIYVICQQQLLLEKACDKIQDDAFCERKSHLSIFNLLNYVDDHVFKRQIKYILLILGLACLFLGGLSLKTEQTKTKWMDENRRYCFSHISYEESKPVYYTARTLDIDGEAIPIGLMSYEDAMNMYTKSEQKRGDIIVSESLARRLNGNQLIIEGKTYEYTNILYEDMNETFVQKRKYLLFIPSDQYPVSEDSEIFYYVQSYSNEEELEALARKLDNNQNLDYLSDNPVDVYESYKIKTQALEALLQIVPLGAGVILVMWELLSEKKYLKQLSWLREYGLSIKSYRLLAMKRYMLVWILCLLLVILPFLSSLLSWWSNITIVLYFFFSVYRIRMPKIYLN